MRLVIAALCVAAVLTHGRAGAEFSGVCGDADGDGNVSVSDGVNALRAAAELSSSCSLAACDVNGDGGITVADGVNILRRAGGLSSQESCGTATAIRTVFLIVMENHNWADIKGSPSAPFINDVLLPSGAHAEQYFNPPGIHPSEPNYLWLEAGTDFGIRNDRPPSANHQSTTAHLVTLLANAGITWTSYQEDITGTSCPLSKHGLYAPKHNAMVFFDDVTDANDPQSATCIAHVRPYPELATNLENGTVARYNFITPNLCNDMHDSCDPVADPIKQGDTWLSTAIPAIQSSSAYQAGGVILVTWDEGEDDSDGPIGLIVLSPLAKPGGYENGIHYTHSSTLRSLQEIFGVAPLLGDAANASDLADLFETFP